MKLCNICRERIKRENPDAAFTDITKIAAEQWNRAGESVKKASVIVFDFVRQLPLQVIVLKF